MHLRYLSMVAGLIHLVTLPAQAQQAPPLFLCAAPDVIGGSPTSEIGGVDVSECSAVIGLDSGVEVPVDVGGRRTGPPRCKQVEVHKPIDPASPTYLTIAFQGTRIQRVDLLFFAQNQDIGEIEQTFELSLRQSTVAGVSQELVGDRVIERIVFVPTRIVATFADTGAVADIRCDGR